jgi:hypothetical protein
MNRRVFVVAVLLSVAFAAGCKKGPTAANSNEPRQLPDKSTVVVNIAPDGRKTEARVFEEGELLRATRITGANAEPMVLVELRDGRNAVLKDPNDVARVLESSEEEIASSAKRILGATPAPQPQGGSVTTSQPDAKKPATRKQGGSAN